MDANYTNRADALSIGRYVAAWWWINHLKFKEREDGSATNNGSRTHCIDRRDKAISLAQEILDGSQTQSISTDPDTL